MDFQRLRTFRTVATLMNFNQAAEVLNYAQSSVSAQIKALEHEAGTLFFNRAGKQISLTEAGRKMLKYADRILSINEEAMADLSGNSELAGTLTIRAPQTIATYYLPEVLALFQPKYPKVRLDVSSCAFHSLDTELRIGTVDLAFLLAESVQSAGMHIEMVAQEKLVVVAGPRHPLTRLRSVGYRDLENDTVFLPKADCGYRMQFEHDLTSKRIESVSIMEFNSIEAIKKCVISGLGITIIPEIAVRHELQNRELVSLPWQDDHEVGVLMIWQKDRWLPKALQAFMDMVRSAAGEGTFNQ